MAAAIAASHKEPSFSSASLATTKTRREEPCIRAASAAPTPKDSPCPSDPVEKIHACEAVFRVYAEQARVCAVGLQLLLAEPAAQVQRSVDGEGGVPL